MQLSNVMVSLLPPVLANLLSLRETQNVDKTKRTYRDNEKKLENNLLLESIVKECMSLQWTE